MSLENSDHWNQIIEVEGIPKNIQENMPLDLKGLENLCDLESSEELFTYNQPLYQNGKRCGVIFVSTERSKTQNDYNCKNKHIKKRFLNRNYQNDLSLNIYDSLEFSFIVVRGKTSNIWSFPKGRMSSETENEEDCAIREVYEETGFRLKTIQGLPRIVIGRNVYFIYHTTKEDIKEFTIYDNFEVGEVSWKTMNELKNLKCNKDIRAILRYPYKKYSYHEPVFNLTNTPSPTDKMKSFVNAF